MEQLKPQHALTMPDLRQAGFSVYDSAIGSFRPYTLDDLYKSLSTINLHSGVPEEVRSHFSTAQNLVAFSWHHYPFNVTAQLMGHVTIEFALRQVYPNMTNRSFKKLVELAVNEGRISEKGFSHYVEPETSHLPPELKDIYVIRPESEYLDALIKAIPGVRNTLAHGSTNLHMHGLRSVRFCADFINQLFLAPQPEA